MHSNMLTVGDIFSGIGGFSAGFDRAGCRTIFFCEIDPRCRAVLKRHWPGIPRFRDVSTVTGAGLRNHGLVPDILAGGFPCQDLSVAGARAGLGGERSSLFFQFARIAEEARPEWILIENVPGLLSSGRGRDMGTVLGVLADIGYMGAWRVLDAQYFGVAQRRRRVFIVGRLGDGAGPYQILFEPEGVRRDPPSRGAAEQDAARAAEAGARGYGINGGGDVSGPFGSNGAGGLRTTDLDTVGAYVVHATHEVAPCLQEREGKGQDSDATRPMVVAYGVAENQRAEVLLTEGYSRQITTGGGKPGQGYPAVAYNGDSELAVRRLTPLECERLQGFPDGWTDGQPDSVRYRQLGNAVAVPVVAWIASRLAALVAAERAAA